MKTEDIRAGGPQPPSLGVFIKLSRLWRGIVLPEQRWEMRTIAPTPAPTAEGVGMKTVGNI